MISVNFFFIRRKRISAGSRIMGGQQCTAHNGEKAARILGIGERALCRKVKEYDLWDCVVGIAYWV
jgi:hypothetical protein